MYQAGFYQKLSDAEISRRIEEEGFDPLRISDPPGHIYPPHTHAETKLLAFLRGGMEVRVADEVYRCQAGDRLLIPGNVVHSAAVGAQGCLYFWSERLE